MLALLSNAVLAAVVTHAPLKAVLSQTGFWGVGGGVVTAAPDFFEQEQQTDAITTTTNNKGFNRSWNSLNIKRLDLKVNPKLLYEQIVGEDHRQRGWVTVVICRN